MHLAYDQWTYREAGVHWQSDLIIWAIPTRPSFCPWNLMKYGRILVMVLGSPSVFCPGCWVELVS